MNFGKIGDLVIDFVYFIKRYLFY